MKTKTTLTYYYY